MTRNNKNFHALTVYAFDLIRREAAEQERFDFINKKKHYQVKKSAVVKLHKLAAEAVNDWETLMEGERAVVGFFAVAGPYWVERYLRSLPQRRLDAGGFCVLTVLQFLEAVPEMDARVEAQVEYYKEALEASTAGC